MGLIELANSLGMDKGLCSRLVKKGMPITSAEAANAWRAIHAKPRAKRGGTSSPSSITKPITPAPAAVVRILSAFKADIPPDSTTDAPADDTDGPAESLRRARQTERASFRNLERLQKDRTASPEDLRKSSSIYFASRANRQRAEGDYREYERAAGITLFFEEAQDLAGRPHLAARNLLSSGAKELSVRCHGQPQRQIEATISAWLDRLAATIHSAI